MRKIEAPGPRDEKYYRGSDANHEGLSARTLRWPSNASSSHIEPG